MLSLCKAWKHNQLQKEIVSISLSINRIIFSSVSSEIKMPALFLIYTEKLICNMKLHDWFAVNMMQQVAF